MKIPMEFTCPPCPHCYTAEHNATCVQGSGSKARDWKFRFQGLIIV